MRNAAASTSSDRAGSVAGQSSCGSSMRITSIDEPAISLASDRSVPVVRIVAGSQSDQKLPQAGDRVPRVQDNDDPARLERAEHGSKHRPLLRRQEPHPISNLAGTQETMRQPVSGKIQLMVGDLGAVVDHCRPIRIRACDIVSKWSATEPATSLMRQMRRSPGRCPDQKRHARSWTLDRHKSGRHGLYVRARLSRRQSVTIPAEATTPAE